MKLEIRNLQSSASYTIDPEGAVLGREGSKANIILRDQAVSKKHAKIYEKNGKWYLEDLASSNGTFLENRRITEPVILNPGAVFALSENQFEVVQIMNGKAALDLDTDAQDPPDRQALDDLPPLGMTPGDSVDGEGKRSRPMRSSPSSRNASPAQAGADPADLGDDDEKQGVAYFMKAVPKAIAYYLVAVPLMLVNPVGSIRKSVENQRFPALGAFPLIAYGIPPLVFSGALGWIVGVLASLVHGHLVLNLGGLIFGPIGGVIGAIIGAFLLHPLGKFFINKLFKGDSDEKSRTNYYLTFLTAIPLISAGQNLGVLLASIPVPFIGVLAPVVMTAAILIMIFIMFTWMKYFNVVAWVPKVLLVLGVLAGLGIGVLGVLGAISSSASSLGGGGTPIAGADVPGLTPEQKAAMEELSKGVTPEEAAKRAQEALAKAGVNSGDVAEATKRALEAAQKAGTDPAAAAKLAEDAVKAEALRKEAEKTAAAATKEVEKAGEKAAEKVAKAEEKEEEEEETAPPPKNNGTTKTAVAAQEEETEKPARPSLASATNTDRGAGGPSGEFQDFIQKRKEVDSAIEADPTLLKKKDVLASYEKYLRKTFEVRSKWKKKKAKDETEQRINDRMKDIEVFEATSKLVAELHRKIF